MIKNTLTLDFSDGLIMVNEETRSALGYPEHIQILINQDERLILIRACELDSEQAVVLPAEGIRIEIGARGFLKKICRITGWNDKEARICSGEAVPGHQAVMFNLDDSETIK